MMTVAVLAVLWLIVVVPMVVRRNDERRRDRMITGFGYAMRALGRRANAGSVADVFVPSRARTQADDRQSLDQQVTERIADIESTREAAPVVPGRRPMPSAQEALMYPVDREQMSEARAAMMRRRRRALGTLVVGAIGFTAAALFMGGLMFWAPAALFLLGLGGYLYFLRDQALKDRDRRAGRLERAVERRASGYDATTDEAPQFVPLPESVVRIDDDDLELQNMDTIDLTGIYTEELVEQTAQRRAS